MAIRWASGSHDITALGLVGSWARGAERMSSDIDLVVLTTSPEFYLESEAWLGYFGPPPLVRTRQWGVLTERRVRFLSGLEVEFGFTMPAWAAAAPIDVGTYGVVSDGLRPLHDPAGVLRELITAVHLSS